MRTLTIIFVLIFVISGLFSCDNNNNSGNNVEQNFSFRAEVNGKKIEFDKMWYSEENQILTITGVNKDGTILTVSCGAEPGKYTSENNDVEGSIVIGEDFYSVHKGIIEFKKQAGGNVSGIFSLSAKNQIDTTKLIEINNVTFENIVEQKADQKELNIVFAKQMLVNAESGDIKNTNYPAELLYTNNILTIKYPENQELSFSLKIKEKQNNNSSFLFYTDNQDINYISVDLINKNQTTVWYKNGNTLTLF